MPKGWKVIGCRWVHTYKGDGHENGLKTKSRVVAKGFTQVQNVDYHDTTPPTPASAPVKMIATIANEKGLPVFHLVEKEIYIRLPPSCGELSGKVVKLIKCQYGLKQAGMEWRLLSVTWLVKKIGMEQCKAESCAFRKIIKNEVSLMVGVHVDDIIVSGEQDLCDNRIVPSFSLGHSRVHNLLRKHAMSGRTTEEENERPVSLTALGKKKASGDVSTSRPTPRTSSRSNKW